MLIFSWSFLGDQILTSATFSFGKICAQSHRSQNILFDSYSMEGKGQLLSRKNGGKNWPTPPSKGQRHQQRIRSVTSVSFEISLHKIWRKTVSFLRSIVCTQYMVSENAIESDCLHKVDITHLVIISLAYKQYWQLSLIFKCTYKIKNTQTWVIGVQSRCESHKSYHDFGWRDFSGKYNHYSWIFLYSRRSDLEFI